MSFQRFGAVALGAVLLVAGGAQARAAASEATAVMATVHQFVDGFNRGDVKMGAAACASPVSIIDEFPPHEWQGPDACVDWSNAYNANAERNGITDGFVTLGTPWHVDVTGQRAYAVVPSRYAYKQRGKLVVEPDSVFTLALEKTSAGWRITGWAWSKH